MKKKSFSSHNQIFAVPLQPESPWQTAKGLFFKLFFIHSFFNVQINFQQAQQPEVQSLL